MVVTGQCNTCDKQVLLSNDEEAATQLEVVPYEDKETGKQYEIKLFICPHCGNIQTVQIDNLQTKKLFMKCLKLLRQANATTKRGQIQSLKSVYEKQSKKLNEARLKLSIESDGKTFVNYIDEELIYKAPVNSGVIND